MESDKRREEILRTIQNSQKPIKGSHLAALFNVSRQIIVQDIAILRAGGEDIIATSQGYISLRVSMPERHRRILACRHWEEGIEDELMTVVDLGGTIVDVIVEHEIYGEFKAGLMISSPSEVRSFMKKVKKEGVKLLSSLKEGIHLHTIEAESPQKLDEIENALKDKGYILEKE